MASRPFPRSLALSAVVMLGACGSSPRGTMPAPKSTLVPAISSPATSGTASSSSSSSSLGSTSSSTTSTMATTTTTREVLPLRIGDHDPLVATVQDKLRAAGYDPGPTDGQFGPATLNAVWAFQRVNGLTADGDIGPLTMAALDNPKAVEPMLPDGPADRVEISIDRKLLVLYKEGLPVLVTHVSSGSRIPFCENGVCGDAVTPLGDFRAIQKIDGWEDGPLGQMFNSIYFWPAYAIHGSPSVPDVGASHGCVRVPMHIAEYLPSMIDLGTAIHVQQD